MASTDRLAPSSGHARPSLDRSSCKPSFGGRPPLAPAASIASSASYQSLSAHHPSAVKWHSLFGTEDRIVLDIGSRISKLGFSGEERPRIVIPSVPLSQPSTSSHSLDTIDSLWDLNAEMVASEHARKDKHASLFASLVHLLRSAFFHHLMVDPKQRKVILLENAAMPNIVKELICKVLLSNLQVPSVSFVSSHLSALVATGRITGLVVECGYLETSILPIYYGRPMTSHTRVTPRAGKLLNNRLRALLVHHAKFVPSHTAASASASAFKQKASAVPRALLNDDVLEHVKAKTLVVGPYEPDLVRAGQAAAPAAASALASTTSESAAETSSSPGIREAGGLPSSSSAMQSSTNPFAEQEESKVVPSLDRLYHDLKQYDEVDDVVKMHVLKAAYRRSTKATSLALALPSVPSLGPSASTASASAFLSEASTNGILVIPGWVRDRAAEILFEAADRDEEEGASIIELAVDAIRKLPIDMRRTMCESILVTGGTAMLPGMVNRFRVQLEAALKAVETNKPTAAQRRLRSSSATGEGKNSDHLQPQNPVASSAAKDGSLLHHHIAVLNDPWPKVPPETGRPQGGTAPAFAANLLPFIGTSLLGELKTSSLSEITREAYDEALVVAEKLRKAVAGHGVASGNRGQGTTNVTRPMLGPGNRGSFVGVVGGLETGAFGALAAVSRHLLIGTQQSRAAAEGGERMGDGDGGGSGSGGGGGKTGMTGNQQHQQLRSPTGLGPLRSPPLP